MKKEVTISLVAILALCGCQNKELDVHTPESKPFIATIDDNYLGAETKTSLDNQGNVLWKQGDQISIFAGSTINEQWQVTDASDGKTAAELYKISGDGFNAGGEISNNVAFYPYSSTNTVAKNEGNYVIGVTLPATQNYAEASFGNGAFPMAAVTSSTADMNLKFKNILGGLKLQLKGTASIASISISGNNNEILCGDAEVTASTSSKPSINLTDGSAKTVTMNCGVGVQLNTETATPFVIALPPMTMAGGFTVTVIDTEGKQMEIKTTKSQTIARSSILKMPAVEYEGIMANISLYEMVDLGLPSGVKWANMNIGASSPSSVGTWFAFGDVIGSLNWDTYDDDVYMNLIGGSGTIAGPGDPFAGYGCLPSSYDAATVIMGENWRTPSYDDFEELFEYCDVFENGTTISFVSRINSTELLLFNDLYWLDEYDGEYALYADPKYQDYSWNIRQETMQIRGVYGLPKHQPNIAETTISNITNKGAVLSSNITKDGGAEITERGFYLKTGSSSNYDVITVQGSGIGEFSYTLSGLSHATQYSVAAYATNSVGTSVSSWVSFKTDRNPIPAEYRGTLDGHDWVDIGLRKSHIDSKIVPGSSEDRIIAFATSNIGASNPENTGYYFRWGEQKGWDITVQDSYSFNKNINTAVQRDRDGKATSEIWTSSTFSSSYYLCPDITAPTSPSTGFFQNTTRKTDLQWYSYLYGDAATYNWGENWMTPSIAIFKAMLSVNQSTINFGTVYTNIDSISFGTGANNLTLTISKETINGHNVLLLINDETDAYVILPTYGGYAYNAYVIDGNEHTGYYQTSSILLDDKRYVSSFDVDNWSNTFCLRIRANDNKYDGKAIRPVAELTIDGKQPSYTDEEVSESIEEVDLGLSVKWASMNLGAKNEYDCGLFFRFGELTGHGCFETFDRSWNSYFTSIGGRGSSNSDCGGSGDPLNYTSGSVLPLEFDAAHKTLGGTWRMPTRQEIQELVDNCTFTYLDQSKTCSITAVKLTSKVNKKSIIIPMSGCYYPNSTGFNYTDSSGYFWSSSMYSTSKAYHGSGNYLGLRSDSYMERHYAIPIRAVKE